MFNPWLALTYNSIQLGLDAQRVIALRMMRFAAAGAAGQGEARRMVAEKIAAAAEAQTAAVSAVMAGQKHNTVAGKVLRVYKKRVRANKRRLSRHK